MNRREFVRRASASAAAVSIIGPGVLAGNSSSVRLAGLKGLGGNLLVHPPLKPSEVETVSPEALFRRFKSLYVGLLCRKSDQGMVLQVTNIFNGTAKPAEAFLADSSGRVIRAELPVRPNVPVIFDVKLAFDSFEDIRYAALAMPVLSEKLPCVDEDGTVSEFSLLLGLVDSEDVRPELFLDLERDPLSVNGFRLRQPFFDGKNQTAVTVAARFKPSSIEHAKPKNPVG